MAMRSFQNPVAADVKKIKLCPLLCGSIAPPQFVFIRAIRVKNVLPPVRSC
jgi:hypothetical protein